jgi:hypothetical protein
MSHFIFKNSYQNVTRLQKVSSVFFLFLPLMFCSLDYNVYNSYLSNMSTKHCTYDKRKVKRHERSEFFISKFCVITKYLLLLWD